MDAHGTCFFNLLPLDLFHLNGFLDKDNLVRRRSEVQIGDMWVCGYVTFLEPTCVLSFSARYFHLRLSGDLKEWANLP